MALVNKMVNGHGFISVEDELPKPNSRVIAYTSYGDMVFDMMYKPDEYPDSEWISNYSHWRGGVVAWRPMLERPEFEYVDE